MRESTVRENVLFLKVVRFKKGVVLTFIFFLLPSSTMIFGYHTQLFNYD